MGKLFALAFGAFLTGCSNSVQIPVNHPAVIETPVPERYDCQSGPVLAERESRLDRELVLRCGP